MDILSTYNVIMKTLILISIKLRLPNIKKRSYQEKMPLGFHYPHEVWKMLDFERGERGELTFS